MAVKQKVTVSMQPMARRPSSAERRAAHIATVSTEQAELKHEAAERRASRAMNSNPQRLPSRVNPQPQCAATLADTREPRAVRIKLVRELAGDPRADCRSHGSRTSTSLMAPTQLAAKLG